MSVYIERQPSMSLSDPSMLNKKVQETAPVLEEENRKPQKQYSLTYITGKLVVIVKIT